MYIHNFIKTQLYISIHPCVYTYDGVIKSDSFLQQQRYSTQNIKYLVSALNNMAARSIVQNPRLS